MFNGETAFSTDIFMCGEAKVSLVLPTEDNSKFNINIKNSTNYLSIDYNDSNEYLMIRCQKDHAGKSMVVVNHICGGSGCVESNWSILDPNELKLILASGRPDGSRLKGNHDKAEKIMGLPIKPFSCNNNKGTQNNGEYCIASPIKRG